ncbi:hypothetical protein [Halobacillus litoralis]|uniref:hypothetical protein n=1 Tax=Halobacillus litoralis TaxID=45668 RepID=UPI001CFD8B60|nr:hypothetical protein [Halobacillus litoralis]
MLVTVHPCFHWVGFHTSTHLLQEGVEVIGVDPIEDKRADFLYMYVGRNSNFQHFFQEADKDNHVHQTEDEIVVEYVENSVHVRHSNGNEKWIELPKLYGEWMDLEKIGVQNESRLMEWVKKNEAVYIGDFVEDLIPFLCKGVPFELTVAQKEEQIADRVSAVWRCQELLERL